MTTDPRPLAGRRVLIVEDRYLLASYLAGEVAHLGGEVLGPSPDVGRASLLVSEADVAILDINLGDDMVFPLADALDKQGVPFVFVTGYDRDMLPSQWRDRPILSKPVQPRALHAELMKLSMVKPGKRRS